MTGRPSSYTDELANELCERIACGESLRSICREDGKPDQRTVMRWLASNETFRQQYVRAREDMADSDADSVNDVGIRVLTGELDPQAARVAIDALKWAAGKRNAKKYGDRQIIAGDADAPLEVRSLPPEQLQANIIELMRLANESK